MKTINWYIGKMLLGSTLLALGILTFIMFSGHLFRIFELINQGISPSILGRYMLYLLPDILRFTLPLSILVSTVLIFGRMSADNEISALKAGGVSLWQIIAPGLLLCFIFCALSIYLTLSVTPCFRFEAHRLRWSTLASAPLALLEPGMFSAVSDTCQIRVGARNGNELQDIHLVIREKNGSMRDIVAARGRIHTDFENREIKVILNNALITEIAFSDGSTTIVGTLSAAEISHPLSYDSEYDHLRLARKGKFLTLNMLLSQLKLTKPNDRDRTTLLFELYSRLALALSPFAFFLLGLPFGIRGKRSELSVGLLLCVALGVIFYALMLTVEMFEKNTAVHPELLVWLPNAIYLTGGLFAIRQLSKH